ncbi:hypothetical protein P692DRAFT_20875252 [Suillus brevipes Sb2]|nr:hypothetical protein P692DRAFT_20875252 [Suillus brevipes Sb2]
MFAQVTDKNSADLGLSGTVDVTIKTAIGDVPISGIAFDVTSSLAGINSFDGKATISNISISGSSGNGGDQYIILPLTSSMNNFYNISLDTVDIILLLVGGVYTLTLTLYRWSGSSVALVRGVCIVGRGRLSTPSLSIVGRGPLPTFLHWMLNMLTLPALQFSQDVSPVYHALDKHILLPHAPAKWPLCSKPFHWN